MALYRSPLTVTLWPSSFLKKYGPMIPPAHKAHQRVSFSECYGVSTYTCGLASLDVAIQPEVRFIAKQNSLMKIGNNGNLVLGPFDESTPCLIIFKICQVIYSQFGLAIHQNDHPARRRFVEWAPNEIAVVPNFHKRILFGDEAHFWLNGYVNKQNCRIWSEANPQVYVETPLHPEKLTVWCALCAGGILLQKR
ncbi:hypothetical protein TNCV_985851 [Trichonephila clavipes]|uniref:Uncharacterized protein n=1 Tax=Trichonephila clavipes TaxID=2585209 RepID=A0A8X6SLW6_TRICX|nr:hypothetical protein TNCV_985851 [Trichonephila clavipes]